MSLRRAITIAISTVLGMLVLAGASGPAQAAPDVPSAPAGGLSVAAMSPGISPPAEHTYHIDYFDDYNCPLGRACMQVWDPTVGKWKIFNLFRCGTYNLSYWYGWGTMRNNQTDDAAVVLYGENGADLGSYPPSGPPEFFYQVNWTPVWRIKPC